MNKTTAQDTGTSLVFRLMLGFAVVACSLLALDSACKGEPGVADRSKPLSRPAVDPGPVHDAVRTGDLAKVKAAVAENPEAIDEKDDRERTAFLLACAAGNPEIVDFLIASGADVRAVDDLGQTALHLAAAAGHKDVVDRLIAKGVDIRATCRDGRTLLHSAAVGGLIDVMERLLEAGFPVDDLDRYGRTPLLKAAAAGQDAAAEFLLSRGANVMARDYYRQTPLHEAAFSGNLRLLDVLVNHGAEVDAINEEGSTPLLYVSQAGRADVIDWLLDHGAKLDVRNKVNETPLTFPLGNGFIDLVEKLWPRAAALKDKDLLEKYPLHRAAYLGNAKTAAFLLEKGLPIDFPDEYGRSVFQRAQGGSVELAKMLADKGADIGAPDPDGSTPLHLAVKKGRTEMVRFLLSREADAKAKDGRGRSALDLARAYSYPGIAALLEESGAGPAAGGESAVPALLAKPLKKGEAIIWSLGHCGFAVKTRSRLLIFDYFSRGWPRPEKPSLANGFVDPEEIKDLDVTVFVSHAHGDHFDPVILSWRTTVKHIRYVFGWNARKGERTIDLPAPRATTALDGMEIYTVNDEHDDVPEVAYLVKVDGLSIYHSGDYMGPLDAYANDMAYLLKKAGMIDIGFIEKFRQAESLMPRVVFPIHAFNREFYYGAFAREAAEKKLPSRVICPENKGDRFEISR
jgi:ankyrin repeat protein/L-ascorbate metabolism protein UlaG (beta-lactamase superfamily)